MTVHTVKWVVSRFIDFFSNHTNGFQQLCYCINVLDRFCCANVGLLAVVQYCYVSIIAIVPFTTCCIILVLLFMVIPSRRLTCTRDVTAGFRRDEAELEIEDKKSSERDG